MNGKEKVLKMYVESGNTKGALQAAKLIGRELTGMEIDLLIEINEKDRRDLQWALAAAEAGKREEKAKDIADRIVQGMKGYSVEEAILEFASEHCRQSTINELRKEIGKKQSRKWAEAEDNRNGVSGIVDSTEEQLTGFVGRLVIEGRYNRARYVIKTKSRTDLLIVVAVNECLEKGEFYWAAEYLACWSEIPGLSELVFEKCLENGDFCALANLAGKPGVSNEVNERIIKKVLGSPDSYMCAPRVAKEIGRFLTQDEVDGAVVMLAEKGMFDKVLEAPENGFYISGRAREGLLAAYVKHGRLEEALRMAKAIGRSLTVNETAQIIKYCLEKEKDDNFLNHKLEEVARLGTTQEAADSTVCYFIEYGCIGSEKLARDLKVSKAVLEKLLEYGLSNGYEDITLEAVALLKRDLTTKEIDRFVDGCLAHFSSDKIFRIAKLGASPEAVEKIKAHAIKHGFLKDAKMAATMQKTKLSQEEIQKIVAVCIRQGRTESAAEAAEFLTD